MSKPIKLSSLPIGTKIVKEYRHNDLVTQVITQKDQEFRMWVRVTFDLWEMVRESMILDYLELTGRDHDVSVRSTKV